MTRVRDTIAIEKETHIRYLIVSMLSVSEIHRALLQKRIAALTIAGHPPSESHKDSVREQQHNFLQIQQCSALLKTYFGGSR